MGNQQHTPGPWRAFDPEGRGGDAIPIIDAQGATFAAVEAIDITDEQAHERQQANARLIAAAPDLLAACEFALRFYQDNFENFPIAYQSVVDFMESAIRKAEGGQ